MTTEQPLKPAPDPALGAGQPFDPDSTLAFQRKMEYAPQWFCSFLASNSRENFRCFLFSFFIDCINCGKVAAFYGGDCLRLRGFLDCYHFKTLHKFYFSCNTYSKNQRLFQLLFLCYKYLRK